MISEIYHNYVVHVPRNSFNQWGSPVKYFLLVIQIIPAGSQLTPSSVNIHPRSYGIQNSSQVGPGTGIVCDSFCPKAILFPGGRASLSFFSVFTLSVCLPVVPWSLTFRGLYYQKVDPSILSECVFPNSLLLRDQEGCLFAVPDTRGIT